MSKFYSLFTFVITFFLATQFSVAQCDNCIPDTNCSSPDGMPVLCPEQLPDATTGIYYSNTATFFMPQSLIDAGTGIEASLISVTLASLTGVPLGLEIVPDNPDGVYYPSSGEEYGCVTICGTPLVAGEYSVELTVAVLVSAFGFEQTVNESFSLPFTVTQGEQTNGSFSSSALSGCVPLEVQLENTITGPGTTYVWDLGGYGTGTELNMSLTTDNYGTETTWSIIDENGTLVAGGGPYSNAQNNYTANACVGNGCYTLNVYDSYGDGMQYGDVIGNYILTDSQGNTLAEITPGGNFGAHAEHAFCIYFDQPSGCTPTSSNPSVIFDTPGVYQVGLTTTVTQLVMTGLNITSLSGGWSGDVEELFWGNPDPYFNISGGDLDFTSSSYAENETPNFTGLNIPLAYGTEYFVGFFDEDEVTNDDYLGSANFIASAPGEYMINGGGNTAIITITETTAAIFEDTESIVVYGNIDAYLDLDGDGFGDGNYPVDGCDETLESSVAFNGEDCNDSDASIYPGAIGTFLGIDNDCNEVVEDDEELAIEGCMIEDACNYNPEANVENDSCEFESCLGCTDPLATNYDPTALINNQNCLYAYCFGDFNNDGAITVSDLLILLAAFGCSEDCSTDLSGDDIVSVADLLEILAVYGTLCE